MCRRHYGNAWGSECLADPIGIEGQVLGGVSMKPSVPGEWRWLYDGVVRFHTEGRFSPSPATEFVIDFSQARFLADVKLANPRTIYTTQPQAAFLDRELVWIEPSDKEAHGLSIRPMQPNRATRANDMAKFPLP